MILENISINFAHDFNFEKCLESSKISSKIFLSSSLGVLGTCILSLVWLKPIDLQIYASFLAATAAQEAHLSVRPSVSESIIFKVVKACFAAKKAYFRSKSDICSKIDVQMNLTG